MIELLAAVIGSGLLVPVALYLKKYIDNQKIKTNLKALESKVRLYDLTRELFGELGAQSCGIYKIKNGGSTLSPLKPIFVTCVFKNYVAPYQSFKDLWDNRPVQEHFTRYIKLVMEDNIARYQIPDAEEGISDVFVSCAHENQIHTADFIFVGANTEAVFYAVVNYRNMMLQLTDQQRLLYTKLQSEVGKML